MTLVKLDWSSVKFEAKSVRSWKHLKQFAKDDSAIDMLRSKRAVYVIRVRRPFCFAYAGGQSPVAYIGKGDAPARLRSHLGGWISELREKIPGLKLEIYVCEPRLRKSGRICEKVEAALLEKFRDEFEESPLQNTNEPKNSKRYEYAEEDVRVLYKGKGPGYHWALKPIGSSSFNKAF